MRKSAVRRTSRAALPVVITALCATPGHSVATGGTWPFGEGSDGSHVATKVGEFKDKFAVGGLNFNADGTQLATNGQVAGPEVHLWNWRSPGHGPKSLEMHSIAQGGVAISFNRDGTLLAVGHGRDPAEYGYGVVRIWETKNWSVEHDIMAPEGGSGDSGLAFTPDGKLLVRTITHMGPEFIVNSADTWEQLWGLDARPTRLNRVAVSPDGRFAAASGYFFLFPSGGMGIKRTQIVIVDLSSRKTVTTISEAFPDENEIQTLAWSADGKALAAGAIVQGSFPGPDAVRIFDPMSGKQLGAEPADTAYVSGLAYSANGKYLIAGYIGGEVRIWDGSHSQLLQKIPTNMHFHTALGISRDSHYLAVAAGPDVTVWQLK